MMTFGPAIGVEETTEIQKRTFLYKKNGTFYKDKEGGF